MSRVEELIELIEDWGDDRGINDVKAQLNKVVEEIGEIAHEINRNNYESDKLTDAIGDTVVTLIILAHLLGMDLTNCLNFAYNEIKDRKGHLENGSWIKDINDPNYREDIEGWGNPEME